MSDGLSQRMLRLVWWYATGYPHGPRWFDSDVTNGRPYGWPAYHTRAPRSQVSP